MESIALVRWQAYEWPSVDDLHFLLKTSRRDAGEALDPSDHRGCLSAYGEVAVELSYRRDSPP